MKVVHVAASDLDGGANRAAYRIHQSLGTSREGLDIASSMRVITKRSDDPSVVGGPCQIDDPLFRYAQPRLLVHHRYSMPFGSANHVHHSFGWPDSGMGKELNRSDHDLIHLHWVGHLNGYETISIKEIGRLNKPVVWTLHDQWAFCGAEHYTAPPPAQDRRYIEGYKRANRSSDERGRDRNRAIWLMKRKYWQRPMHIICPSQWMAECAKESWIMSTWPITVIPYPIDLTFWSPQGADEARRVLGLPLDKAVVLFGAVGGLGDSRKGGDLLQSTLQHLRSLVAGTGLEETELAIFGQSEPSVGVDFGFTAHYFGNIDNDLKLRLLYSAADVFVLPSRQDNLPNTGIEAHACGTPVVGFRTGGLVDIVDHQQTGILAEPFDPSSLAMAIQTVIECPDRCSRIGHAARIRAEQLWSPRIVAAQYKQVYGQLREATV
jgi:glycosyltransferase involved in cell wall biosynthesis